MNAYKIILQKSDILLLNILGQWLLATIVYGIWHFIPCVVAQCLMS